MANFQLRIHQFGSGAVGIYADRQGGNDIIRIHRLQVTSATGHTNYNTIKTLYPENASSLFEWFWPHPATTTITAVATYEEIDHREEATASYSAPVFNTASVPELEAELRNFS